MAPPNVLDMSQPQPLFVSFHSIFKYETNFNYTNRSNPMKFCLKTNTAPNNKGTTEHQHQV